MPITSECGKPNSRFYIYGDIELMQECTQDIRDKRESFSLVSFLVSESALLGVFGFWGLGYVRVLTCHYSNLQKNLDCFLTT